MCKCLRYLQETLILETKQYFVTAKGKSAIPPSDMKDTLVSSIINGLAAFHDRNTAAMFYLHELPDIPDITLKSLADKTLA